jgi:predicted CxxxxCH...CXXCH cytochrome family protein
MLRKWLVVISILAVTVPVMANATSWYFNTQAKSSGGVITSRNMQNQRSTAGSVFKSYTTHAGLGVTVSADAGYSIRDVTVNGIAQGAQGRNFTTTVQGMTSQSVIASFAPDALQVTAQVASPGGDVSPATVSNIVYGSKLYAPLVFSFQPRNGFQVAQVNGYSGATLNVQSFPAAVGKTVTVTYPKDYVFTTSVALTAQFTAPNPIASVSLPQSVFAGSLVTLTGSSLGAPTSSYQWSYLSGPANIPGGNNSFTPGPPVALTSNSNTATFSAPSTPGLYQFKLTLEGGSSAVASVIVTASQAATGRSQCQFCHTANGIGPANLFANWSASGHKANKVTCSKCHIGTDVGGHPGQLTGGSVSETTFAFSANHGSGNFCLTCHNPAIVTDFAASAHLAPAGAKSCSFCHLQGVHNPAAACVDCHYPGNNLGLAWPPAGLDFHNDYNGTKLCSNCHNLHNPGVVTGMSGPTHYNNVTSGSYPASYVTSRAACSNCHVSNPGNALIRHQWDRSRHAATTGRAWTAYDFKTMSGCVQCHTTTGFIAYSTGKVTAAWGVASDKTKEVLACNGCHSDVANGVVRKVTPVRPFAGDSYQNRDVATSNICMDCHSGRNNGLSISSGDFANQPFIAPHYLAAGGILHGKGGYRFSGTNYAFYSSNTHRTVGMADNQGTGSDGPCVACHMTAPQKHLFRPVSTASNGAIAKITATSCAACHGTSLDDTILINSRQQYYDNALAVLKTSLDSRGFSFSANYPYFAKTDWTTFHNPADTMGAAFNYVLLLKEPGAYAHNPAYAKQLLLDSIDYLHNGSVTGSIDSAADSLVKPGGISQAQADSLKAYQASTVCTSCHGNPPPNAAARYAGVSEATSPHLKHAGKGANYGFDCNECHKGNSHGNGSFQDVFLDKSGISAGTAASYNGTIRTCSTLYCHSNGSSVATGLTPAGSVVWGSNKLDCGGCHGNPPAYANNTPKANNHGSHPFGCQTCHAATTGDGLTIANRSRHVNGSYDLAAGPGATFSYTFAANGGSCSNVSCHPGLGFDAKWGSNVDHVANLTAGDITIFPEQTDHDPWSQTMTEQCSLCHYANIAAQHNYNCAVCHSGTTPAASGINKVNGSWDKNCQSGLCHPTIHSNAAFESVFNNHELIVHSCESCHVDGSGGAYGGNTGDNCAWCHTPARTVAAVGDHLAPVTTSDAQASYLGTATVHLTATDAGSGVSLTLSSSDTNHRYWNTGSEVYLPAPASGSKTYAVWFYSTDHAMNVESVKQVSVTVSSLAPDTTPPVTTSGFNPASGAIYQANQPVTLAATDSGSGVKSTYYKIDAGAYVQGTTFTVTGEGLHSFSYYSVDNANNTETAHVSNSFRIDSVAPVTTCSAVEGSSYTGAQTFTLLALDPGGSGVASTRYQLDSGAWSTGTSIAVAAPASGSASHTISWYSLDVATNQEATHTVTFTVQAPVVDTTPPVTTALPNPASGAIYAANQTITLTPSDSGSGVKATYYKIDAGAFVPGTSFAVTGDGLHSFSYYSVDNANNTETVHVSNSFRIDTIAPVTTCSAVNGASYTGNQSFTLSASDAGGSGVASTWYRLDAGAWSSGTAIAVTAPASGSASHTISWYSIDAAGIQEATKSVSFTVGSAGIGTATLVGSNDSPSGHPFTHFWVSDATDTVLIADGGWSTDDHNTGASFVVPAGVAYVMHFEYEYPDYEGGATGSDVRVVSALEAAAGATVTWAFNLP